MSRILLTLTLIWYVSTFVSNNFAVIVVVGRVMPANSKTATHLSGHKDTRFSNQRVILVS